MDQVVNNAGSLSSDPAASLLNYSRQLGLAVRHDWSSSSIGEPAGREAAARTLLRALGVKLLTLNTVEPKPATGNCGKESGAGLVGTLQRADDGGPGPAIVLGQKVANRVCQVGLGRHRPYSRTCAEAATTSSTARTLAYDLA